jgi:uncharacterized membrane protein YccC
MNMGSRALSIAQKWIWPRQDFFGDLRVQYGFKMGLAGLLALFGTQVLRLPHDNWATLTVLVLMGARYVGSIAVKAIMRVIGTIAGGLVGVWLVGDYTSTPAIFLPVLFLVIAFASYKFGQLGIRQVPYAYFLLGLTTLTIATNGVTDPADAWQIGLDRTEEILVGIMSSLLVTTLVWPRYAREEFFEAGRAALKTVSQLVSGYAQTYIDRANAPTDTKQLQDTFGQQLSALRNLQQAGARESTIFSARLSNYNAFLVSLTNLYHAGLDLGRYRNVVWFRDHMRAQIESLSAAFSEEFSILIAPRSSGEHLPSSRLNETFADFAKRVNEIRDLGVLIAAPVETAIAFAGHFAATRALCDELNNIRSAMEGLPRFGQAQPEAKPHWDLLPRIDWFWVKVGVKGGLAAVISIVFLKWIHPPGSAAVPLMAWLNTIAGRPFLRAGGPGDLRAFQMAFRGSLVLIACAGLLIFGTPFLAGYAAMNVALFLMLFTLGFLTARSPGLNFWIQLALLTISTFVGLNPQQPVPSQTIIDAFLGLIFGMLIAAVLGRLLWPVLPQRVVRDNLRALVVQINALLSGDPNQAELRTQSAVLPVETLQAADQIRIAGFLQEEKARVVALVRELQKLVTRMTQLVSRRNILPEIVAPILKPQFERLEVEFKQVLDAFAECFRQGDCRRELPSTDGALTALNHAVEQIRDPRRTANQTLEVPLRALELVDRYHATADTLDECGRMIRKLQIERYGGDYAL